MSRVTFQKSFALFDSAFTHLPTFHWLDLVVDLFPSLVFFSLSGLIICKLAGLLKLTLSLCSIYFSNDAVIVNKRICICWQLVTWYSVTSCRLLTLHLSTCCKSYLECANELDMCRCVCTVKGASHQWAHWRCHICWLSLLGQLTFSFIVWTSHITPSLTLAMSIFRPLSMVRREKEKGMRHERDVECCPGGKWVIAATRCPTAFWDALQDALLSKCSQSSLAMFRSLNVPLSQHKHTRIVQTITNWPPLFLLSYSLQPFYTILQLFSQHSHRPSYFASWCLTYFLLPGKIIVAFFSAQV